MAGQYNLLVPMPQIPQRESWTNGLLSSIRQGQKMGQERRAEAADTEIGNVLSNAILGNQETAPQSTSFLGNLAGQTAPALPQASSMPSKSDDFTSLYQSADQQIGIPGFSRRVAMIESGGNPNARNPKSSAGGLFQFIDSTGNQYGLADKFDPVQATKAFTQLTLDNKRTLTNALGRPPTPGELYLAHQQGAQGALDLIRAGDTSAAGVVGDAAANLNGGKGASAQQMVAKWTAPFRGLSYADATNSPVQTAFPAPSADMLNDGVQRTALQPSPEMVRPVADDLTAAQPAGDQFTVPGSIAPAQARPELPNFPPPTNATQAGNSIFTRQVLAAMVKNPSTRNFALQQLAGQARGDTFQTAYVDGLGLVQRNNRTGQLSVLKPEDANKFSFIQGKNGEIYRADPRGGSVDQIVAPTQTGYRPMTTDEKAAFGLPADQPAYMGPDNQPHVLGKGGVTVNVGGENGADAELRKNLSKNEGERWSKLQEAAVTSAGVSQDMQVLDQLLQAGPEGPLVGKLAEMFPGFSKAGAAAQAIIKRVAPSLRTPGSGSTSDVEYQGMLDALPKLSNRPEANRMIAQMLEAKAQLNVERGQIITQYQNGEIDANTARDRMLDVNKRSILTPQMRALINQTSSKQQPQNGAPAKPTTQQDYDALPSGALFVDPDDGKTYRKP